MKVERQFKSLPDSEEKQELCARSCVLISRHSVRVPLRYWITITKLVGNQQPQAPASPKTQEEAVRPLRWCRRVVKEKKNQASHEYYPQPRASETSEPAADEVLLKADKRSRRHLMK